MGHPQINQSPNEVKQNELDVESAQHGQFRHNDLLYLRNQKVV